MDILINGCAIRKLAFHSEKQFGISPLSSCKGGYFLIILECGDSSGVQNKCLKTLPRYDRRLVSEYRQR